MPEVILVCDPVHVVDHGVDECAFARLGHAEHHDHLGQLLCAVLISQLKEPELVARNLHGMYVVEGIKFFLTFTNFMRSSNGKFVDVEV